MYLFDLTPRPRALLSTSAPTAFVKLKNGSAIIKTLSATFWLLPQASITNGSFTEMQTIKSTPFAWNLSWLSTYPGRCLAEQTDV